MRRVVCIILLLSVFIIEGYSRTLKFGIGFAADHPVFHMTKLYLDEVVKGIDAVDDVVLMSVYYRRAKRMLIEGMIDGDFGRTLLVYEGVDNVHVVNVPISHTVVFGYMKNGGVLEGPGALKGLRFVFERGSVVKVRFMNEHGLDYILVDSSFQAFKMIAVGRADVYVGAEDTARILNGDSFKGSEIKQVLPALFEYDTYIFLSEENKWLVEDFERAIGEFISSGRVEEMFK